MSDLLYLVSLILTSANPGDIGFTIPFLSTFKIFSLLDSYVNVVSSLLLRCGKSCKVSSKLVNVYVPFSILSLSIIIDTSLGCIIILFLMLLLASRKAVIVVPSLLLSLFICIVPSCLTETSSGLLEIHVIFLFKVVVSSITAFNLYFSPTLHVYIVHFLILLLLPHKHHLPSDLYFHHIRQFYLIKM